MKTKQTPSTSGFTLLEVLIAVLIVGIIATALMPMLGSYTEQAREARLVANVQALDRAVQRYELDHQAPWGFVYEPLSEDLYIPYNWEGGLGFVEQLEQPTDAYGNVLGDPGSSVTGPCVHGPYVSDAFAPATLLLGVAPDGGLALPEDGMAVIAADWPQDCQRRTEDTVPLEGGYRFGKAHAKGAKVALIVDGRLAYENLRQLKTGSELKEDVEKRAVERAGMFDRLGSLSNALGWDEVQKKQILVGVSQITDQLTTAVSSGESWKIIDELKAFLWKFRPDDRRFDIVAGQVAHELKPHTALVHRFITNAGTPFVLNGRWADQGDLDRVEKMVALFKGDEHATQWRKQVDAVSQHPGDKLGDEMVLDRARVFDDLIGGRDNGIAQFARTVIIFDPHTVMDTGGDGLLDVTRREQGSHNVSKLIDEIRSLAKIAPIQIPTAIRRYFDPFRADPQMAMIENRLIRDPDPAVQIELLEQNRLGLSQAHAGNLKEEYERLRQRTFVNSSVRARALLAAAGIATPDETHPGAESRGPRRPVVISVGYLVRDGHVVGAAECKPDTKVDVVTKKGAQEARIRRSGRVTKL